MSYRIPEPVHRAERKVLAEARIVASTWYLGEATHAQAIVALGQALDELEAVQMSTYIGEVAGP